MYNNETTCSYCENNANYNIVLNEKESNAIITFLNKDVIPENVTKWNLYHDMLCEFEFAIPMITYCFCKIHVMKLKDTEFSRMFENNLYMYRTLHKDLCKICNTMKILTYIKDVGICDTCLLKENEGIIICADHNIKSDAYEMELIGKCDNCNSGLYRLTCDCIICKKCYTNIVFDGISVNFYDITDSNKYISKWDRCYRYETSNISLMTYKCGLCGYMFGDDTPQYDLSLHKIMLKLESDTKKYLHDMMFCRKTPTYEYEY